MLVLTHLSKYLKHRTLIPKESIHWMQIKMAKLCSMQYLNNVPVGLFKIFKSIDDTCLINLYINNKQYKIKIFEMSIWGGTRLIINPLDHGNADIIIGIKNNKIHLISILGSYQYINYKIEDNKITIYTLNTYNDSLNYTYTARIYKHRLLHQIIKVKIGNNKIVFKSILQDNYYIFDYANCKKYGYRIICFDKKIDSFILGNIDNSSYKIYSCSNNPITHSSLKILYNIRHNLYYFNGSHYM